MYHATSRIVAIKPNIITTAVTQNRRPIWSPYYSHVGYNRKEEKNMESRIH